jgi:hypothetical protein
VLTAVPPRSSPTVDPKGNALLTSSETLSFGASTLLLYYTRRSTSAALQAEGIEIARPISDQGWGLLTAITLPGGVELGLYQPRHPTAAQPT